MSLSIIDLPDPEISLSTVGSTKAGQAFSLVCNVAMPTEALQPTVTWIKVNGGITSFPTATKETTLATTTLTISFSPLKFSHRGQYRCMVTLNISTVYAFDGSKDYNISVNCEYIYF